MRKILTLSAALAMAAHVWAGGPNTQPAQTKAPARKPATASVAKKPGPAATTASAARRTTGARRTAAPAPRTSWRNRQAVPTPDRYREIQSALVARGYLSEEDATGAWGTVSAEALKKFQAEQTLETTGKIDSLSLIALGLGPRRDSTNLVPKVVDGNNAPQLESGRN